MDKLFIRSEAGFTLIEVLAALVILSLLTVSLTGICSSTTIWMGQAGSQLQAGDHAHAIVEHIRAGSNRLNTISSESANPYQVTDSNTDNRQLQLGGLGISIPDPLGLEEQVTIKPVTDKSLYLVEVIVYWQEGGHRRSTTASSLLSAR